MLGSTEFRNFVFPSPVKKKKSVIRGLLKKSPLKKLCNEELHTFHSVPNIIVVNIRKSRGMQWPKTIACAGDIRSAYKILLGKSEGSFLGFVRLGGMIILMLI